MKKENDRTVSGENSQKTQGMIWKYLTLYRVVVVVIIIAAANSVTVCEK